MGIRIYMREEKRGRKSVEQEIKYYPVAGRALGNSTPWIPVTTWEIWHHRIFSTHMPLYVFMLILIVPSPTKS